MERKLKNVFEKWELPWWGAVDVEVQKVFLGQLGASETFTNFTLLYVPPCVVRTATIEKLMDLHQFKQKSNTSQQWEFIMSQTLIRKNFKCNSTKYFTSQWGYVFWIALFVFLDLFFFSSGINTIVRKRPVTIRLQ